MTDKNDIDIRCLAIKLQKLLQGESVQVSCSAMALVTIELMRQLDPRSAIAYVEIFKSELLSIEQERHNKLGIKGDANGSAITAH